MGFDGLDYALLHVNFDQVKDEIEKLDEEERPKKAYLSEDDLKPEQRLFIVHHPLKYPLVLTNYDCRTANRFWRLDNTFAHVCDTLPGSSGAPIYVTPGDYVVGMHHLGNDGFVTDDFAKPCPIYRCDRGGQQACFESFAAQTVSSVRIEATKQASRMVKFTPSLCQRKLRPSRAIDLCRLSVRCKRSGTLSRR